MAVAGAQFGDAGILTAHKDIRSVKDDIDRKLGDAIDGKNRPVACAHLGHAALYVSIVAREVIYHPDVRAIKSKAHRIGHREALDCDGSVEFLRRSRQNKDAAEADEKHG